MKLGLITALLASYAVAGHTKKLVCGQMHGNWAGGRNSDCSWL